MTTKQITVNGKLVTLSKVKSMVPVGIKHVYDLEVENEHNYYAAGISVHNCEYHKVLDNYKNRYGKELYRQSSEFLRYNHQNIEFYPSGPMKRTLRGDCLVGSTMVNTRSGFVHFEELGFGKGFNETVDTIDSPLGNRGVSHTYKKVGREIVSIKTRNGFELKGTPEHPVLVLTPELNYHWVRLDELKAGHFLVSKTAMNQPLFGNSGVTKDMATIIGIFVANGYRNAISSNDPLVIKPFYAAIKRATGRYPKRYYNDPRYASDAHSVYAVDGRAFVHVLSDWGYASVKSAHKQIPLSVRTAPKEILHEFLEAYFACDSGINGGVTAKNRRAGLTTGVEIELCSASSKLVRQLQTILLQAYGILGRIRKHVEYKQMGRHKQNPEKRYVYWILTLSGSDSYTFIKTFKRAKVQKYADRIKDIPAGFGSDRRQLPYVRAVLKEFWNRLERYNCVTTDGTTISKIKRPNILSRKSNLDATCAEFSVYNEDFEKLLAFVKRIDLDLWKRLNRFYTLRAHYEEVVAIRYEDRAQDVYDFTVPEGHAFTANGIASHNTRCLAMIDELGWFPFDLNKDSEQMDDEEDERERANADEVHQSLSNSLATIRTEMWNLYARDINHIPGGIMLNASSPASWKDKICRLLKDAEGSKFMLGLRMPTWEINPIFTRDHPVITEAYRKNPIKADRDFGANPPSLSSSVYSKNAIQRLFTGYQHHALAIEVSDPIIPGEDKKVFGRAVIKHHKNIWPASILALDAGLSNNAFSGVLAFMQEQVMIVATLFEVVPTGGRKIHFPSMMKFIINPIIEQCNVHYVFADRWNSVLLLQQVPMDYPKVLAAQYTLKGRDFDTFNSDFIETGNLVLPKLELPTEQIETVTNYKQELNGYPASHLYLQFLTVRELQGVITKGDGYTDDIYRALVLAAARIRDPKVTEHLRKFAPVERVMGDFSNRLLISGRSGLDFSRVNDMLK